MVQIIQFNDVVRNFFRGIIRKIYLEKFLENFFPVGKNMPPPPITDTINTKFDYMTHKNSYLKT